MWPARSARHSRRFSPGRSCLVSLFEVWFAGRGFLFVLLAKEPVQNVEAGGPEALVEGEPLMRGLERARVEAAHVGPPAHLALDQACALEDLDVLRGRGQRHGEGLGELPDRALAGGEFAQHAPSRRVAQRVKDWGEPGDT